MFALEKLTADAAELLAGLSSETFVQAYEGVHSKRDLEAYCRENYSRAAAQSLLESADAEAVVAFAGVEPAGFYVVRHHDCPVSLGAPSIGVPSSGEQSSGEHSSELKQIYVLAGYYGVGLGHELFESAVECARRQGSQWLWLCVSDKNLRAQAFYKKLGFSKEGAGPQLLVGSDHLPSSILALYIGSG